VCQLGRLYLSVLAFPLVYSPRSSSGGSSLAERLEAEAKWQNYGNTSLSYKPITQSQLKKQLQAEQEALNRAAAQAASATAPAPTPAQPAAPVVIFATAAASVGYYDSAGQYQNLGFKGVAVLYSPTYPNSAAAVAQPGSAPQYTLVCYDPQTQQQDIVAPINEYFALVLQENNYVSFYDIHQTYWSLQVGAPELQRQLALHVGIARYAALHARATLTAHYSQGSETPAAALARLYGEVVAQLAASAGAAAKASAGAMSVVLYQDLSVPAGDSAIPLADGDSAKVFYESFSSEQFNPKPASAVTANADAGAENPDFGMLPSQLAPSLGTPIDSATKKAKTVSLGSGKEPYLEAGLRGLSRGTRRIIFLPPGLGSTISTAYVVYVSKTKHVSVAEVPLPEAEPASARAASQVDPKVDSQADGSAKPPGGEEGDVPTDLVQKQAIINRMAKMSSAAGAGVTPMLSAVLKGGLATPKVSARAVPSEMSSDDLQSPSKLPDMNLEEVPAAETPAPFSYTMSTSSSATASNVETQPKAASPASTAAPAQAPTAASADLTSKLVQLLQNTLSNSQPAAATTAGSVGSEGIMEVLMSIQTRQAAQMELLESMNQQLASFKSNERPRGKEDTMSGRELAAAVQRLVEERNELVEELERRSKRIADLKRDLEKSVIADEEVQDQLRDARIECRKLQTKIKELEYKLAMAEEANSAPAAIPGPQLEELRRLKSELAAAKQENAEAAQSATRVSELQQQIQQLQAEAASANAEAIRNASAMQLLQKQNEQLQRQLQEALARASSVTNAAAPKPQESSMQPSQEKIVSIVEDVLRRVYIDAVETLSQAEVTPLNAAQGALRAVVRRVRKEVLDSLESTPEETAPQTTTSSPENAGEAAQQAETPEAESTISNTVVGPTTEVADAPQPTEQSTVEPTTPDATDAGAPEGTPAAAAEEASSSSAPSGGKSRRKRHGK